MSFPFIAATNNGTDSVVNVTSSTVNLPADISAGEILLALATFSLGGGTPADTGAISWPAGWTELYRAIGPSPALTGACAYREADGSEGSSISVSWVTALRAAWRTLRIIGAEINFPPQAAIANGADLTTMNPPLLTPTWGAARNLWFVTAHRVDVVVTAYPTNYAGNQFNKTTDPAFAHATRELEAASDNPGTFTNDIPATSNNWVAGTLAIRAREAKESIVLEPGSSSGRRGVQQSTARGWLG